VVSIPDCEVLAEDFPDKKLKLVNAWMEIHHDELMANWKLAVVGQAVFNIEALK
jgi:hypothetical protein